MIYDTAICSTSLFVCLFVNEGSVDTVMFSDLWSKNDHFYFEVA